jgi:hypothetical protein
VSRRLSMGLALLGLPLLAAAASPFGVSVRAHVLAPVEVRAAVRASDALLGRVLPVREMAPEPVAAPAPPRAVDEAAAGTPPASRPDLGVPIEHRVLPAARPTVLPPVVTPPTAADERHRIDPRTMPAEPLRPHHRGPPVGGAAAPPGAPGTPPGAHPGEPGVGPGEGGHPRRDGPGELPDRGHRRDGDGAPRPQPMHRGPGGE